MSDTAAAPLPTVGILNPTVDTLTRRVRDSRRACVIHAAHANSAIPAQRMIHRDQRFIMSTLGAAAEVYLSRKGHERRGVTKHANDFLSFFFSLFLFSRRETAATAFPGSICGITSVVVI